MSLAQFKAESEFDNNNQIQSHERSRQTGVDQYDAQIAPDKTFGAEEQQSSGLVPSGGEHPEGPGNPGEPVPIDGLIPILLLSGLSLIFCYQRKNKKINI